jgi:succinate-semialdehyde dehydrogenase/glutarate-semialdehyde dehydrogenase
MTTTAERSDDQLPAAGPASPVTSPPEVAALPADLVARLLRRVTLAPGQHDTQPSYAPFTGELVGRVPVCAEADVDTAVQLAREAARKWAKTSAERRRRIFLRYHDLILDRQAEVLDLVQLETGKARKSAFEELADVAIVARYYAHTAAGYLKPTKRWGAYPGLTSTVEYHHPKGVVGIIAPWNYPLTLPITDAIPALLAGNGVVLKPDSQTPFTALLGVDLLIEAGLPEDLFSVVTGAGRSIGTPMIDRVDYLMFTGSTATGRHIARQCGERLIGFSAELGGKNAMVVCADADVDKTVEGALRACFSNSGQLCISIERMYVEDAIYDEFVPRFTERVAGMVLNAQRDYTAEMGSLITPDQLAVVSGHVDDAVAKGATVLAGGRHRPEIGPLFYSPTVLTGVTADMELAAQETFGPVVALYRVRDRDEAVAQANDTDYGLNASVWTRDTAAGRELGTRLQAGTVNVNEAYAAAWASTDAAMGGMKDSGVGRRHGIEGIRKYTETQTVAVQRVLPMGVPAGMSAGTYAKVMTAALRVLRRTPFIP